MTPEQAKQHLRDSGITLAEWARQHGFSYRAAVDVLNGRSRGHFGQGHEIAVALGIKQPPRRKSGPPTRQAA